MTSLLKTIHEVNAVSSPCFSHYQPIIYTAFNSWSLPMVAYIYNIPMNIRVIVTIKMQCCHMLLKIVETSGKIIS